MTDLESDSMPEPATARATLGLREDAATAEAPALKKKGRGWEISDSRLDALHEQAREMRRHSSDAHKALAEKFAAADLGRYKFTRHAVVGSAIIDFNCHAIGLALSIDEDGQNDALAKRRDKSLESVGIRVMRVPASEVLSDIDAVLQRLTIAMRERIANKKQAARAHKAANPNQGYDRPKPRPNSQGDTDTARPRSRKP